MATANSKYLEEARKILDNYAERTGLINGKGDVNQRYLWTDAFAVQAFFGLGRAFGDNSYRALALNLIEVVHHTLGRYHRDDHRQGWISGLTEEEGGKHPTAGGLRIGKKMLERKREEMFKERMEWERDGQYFHYITRWFNALLQARLETGDQRYAVWAAELLQAAGKFIDKSGGQLRMYWKMSIDLSRPLVPSMGAHDPLEGLICTESALEATPEKEQELAPLLRDFRKLCAGHDWTTSDALGIGGLMLNTLRAAGLAETKKTLPDEVRPEKLLRDSLNGLRLYARIFKPQQAASQRLAFRECGLSLGLRALCGLKGHSEASGLALNELEPFIPLADEIEGFWMDPDKQQASTWTEHLDINAITLAASLLARQQPLVFGGIPSEP